MLYVKDPPWNSWSWSFPIRALLAKSRTFSPMSCRPRPGTSVTMGVIKPLSVATATDISMDGAWTNWNSKKNVEFAIIQKHFKSLLHLLSIQRWLQGTIARPYLQPLWGCHWLRDWHHPLWIFSSTLTSHQLCNPLYCRHGEFRSTENK